MQPGLGGELELGLQVTVPDDLQAIVVGKTTGIPVSWAWRAIVAAEDDIYLRVRLKNIKHDFHGLNRRAITVLYRNQFRVWIDRFYPFKKRVGSEINDLLKTTKI